MKNSMSGLLHFQDWPLVPTKGACRAADLASVRFQSEMIKVNQKAKGDMKKVALSAQNRA